jgi:hypothetical protein
VKSIKHHCSLDGATRMRHFFAGHSDHAVTETGAPGPALSLREAASGINFLCLRSSKYGSFCRRRIPNAGAKCCSAQQREKQFSPGR